MKMVFAFMSLSFLGIAAHAAGPSRTLSSKLNSYSGIAVMSIHVIADESGAAMFRFSRQHFFGVADLFEVEYGKPTLIVRDMTEGKYSWKEMLATSAATLNLRDSLPDFVVRIGCISYVGAFEFDMRSKKVHIAFDQEQKEREQVVSMIQEQYPMEFSKFGMCAQAN
ncbi:MAG TPA: hypothetical protein VGO61_08285 [Steroidobacteraceae bacterium]|jgi:hypothetical protein|nr:hypothetical protein [Steroidobacteraceae bacterium]